MSNEVGRIDNFRAKLDIFDKRQRYTYTYSIYLSDLLSFIISNTDKHEFSSISFYFLNQSLAIGENSK